MIAGVTPAPPPSCSVIVCAYTERRWEQIVAGCAAAAVQLREGDQLVLVIDHNEDLETRARRELSHALVVASDGPRGLSGARNTGIAAATGEVLVFLDDDARPEPGWLDAYRTAFARPEVQVVAGAVIPAWAEGAPPRWFPEEFGWVVGCDYRGLPADGSPVRNPIGANMGIRRSALVRTGGFATEVGRLGTLPLGCEETDLCIRLRQADPAAVMLRSTAASVHHAVSSDRHRVRYFLSRCYYEGRSKAILADRVGSQDSLSTERGYVVRTLSRGVLRGLASGRPSGVLQAVAIVAGFVVTAVGYLSGRRVSAAPAPAVEPVPAKPWQPLVLQEFSLDALVAQDQPQPGTRRRLLVTSAGTPLGLVDLTGSQPTPSSEELVQRVSGNGRSPREDFRGSTAFTPAVSVVVPTRGRSFELVRCVRSLLAVDYPHFEVLVVDNNDRAGAVAELLEPVAHDPRLRVLHQPERGVSPARNLGIMAAGGEIIAATDDDVVVSPQWLSELVAPFADPDIACVTGLVLPDGFKTPAQEIFEEFGGFSKGFHPARYDLRDFRSDHVLYPYSPGIYGSGNNVAYRRSVIAALGGYDRRLGPGTPARAGEDLDVFLKVLFSGASVYYQPRAWVRHHHRDSLDELGRQIRDYGRGLSAVLVTWALSDPRRALDIVRRLPAGLRRLLDPSSDKNEGRTADYPVELRRRELRGMAEGLVLTAWDRVRHPAALRARLEPLPVLADPGHLDEPSGVSSHAV